MNNQRLNRETLKRVKFYSKKKCHPRLPLGIEGLADLYYMELSAAAKTKDVPRMREAKSILYYCLN